MSEIDNVALLREMVVAVKHSPGVPDDQKQYVQKTLLAAADELERLRLNADIFNDEHIQFVASMLYSQPEPGKPTLPSGVTETHQWITNMGLALGGMSNQIIKLLGGNQGAMALIMHFASGWNAGALLADAPAEAAEQYKDAMAKMYKIGMEEGAKVNQQEPETRQ